MAVKLLFHYISRRGFTSALFISDRCAKSKPILTPKLKLAEKFENVEKLQQTLLNRKVDTDASALKSLWELHNSLEETRNALEKRRIEIVSQIKDIKKVAAGKEADTEVEKLKTEGRFVREDLKNLLQAFWDVEERMMDSCLALPNDLHPQTPLDADQIKLKWQEPSKPAKGTLDHLINGKELIDFRDPHWYYLKDTAAIFDLALPSYFSDGLKQVDFSLLVPPDFAHSALIEGCGLPPSGTLLLEPTDGNQNVVGGASLPPILAQLAKQTFSSAKLPLKYVVAGKKYLPSSGHGLFGAWQHTCVDFAVVASDVESHLSQSLEILTSLYKQLDWNFEIVFIAAPNLKPCESFRASFQMFSHYLGTKVEIGSLSVSGTYISERLSIEYDKEGKKDFCQILSGTAVNATAVLACLLETDSPVLLPKILESYCFGKI